MSNWLLSLLSWGLKIPHDDHMEEQKELKELKAPNAEPPCRASSLPTKGSFTLQIQLNAKHSKYMPTL